MSHPKNRYFHDILTLDLPTAPTRPLPDSNKGSLTFPGKSHLEYRGILGRVRGDVVEGVVDGIQLRRFVTRIREAMELREQQRNAERQRAERRAAAWARGRRDGAAARIRNAENAAQGGEDEDEEMDENVDEDMDGSIDEEMEDRGLYGNHD